MAHSKRWLYIPKSKRIKSFQLSCSLTEWQGEDGSSMLAISDYSGLYQVMAMSSSLPSHALMTGVRTGLMTLRSPLTPLLNNLEAFQTLLESMLTSLRLLLLDIQWVVMRLLVSQHQVISWKNTMWEQLWHLTLQWNMISWLTQMRSRYQCFLLLEPKIPQYRLSMFTTLIFKIKWRIKSM